MATPTLLLLLLFSFTTFNAQETIALRQFSCPKSRDDQAPVTALYVFGDSTVDPGNNIDIPYGMQANFLPYGIDFNHTPSGRFTNGKTTADFLALLQNLPIPPAYKNLSDNDRKNTWWGMNYGSSGCGILPSTSPEKMRCWSLDQQIDFFNKTVKEDLPFVIKHPQLRSQFLKRSMFLISIGTNDFIFSFPKAHLDSNAFSKLLLLQLEIRLERLYRIGARRFIVSNIVALGCLPSMLDNFGKCNEEKNQMIMPYVNLLPGRLEDLRDKYSDACFYVADSHRLLNEAIASPEKYGFKDVKDPCCGQCAGEHLLCTNQSALCSNRDEYFFFDGSHGGEAANHLFALLCLDGTLCIDTTSNLQSPTIDPKNF